MGSDVPLLRTPFFQDSEELPYWERLPCTLCHTLSWHCSVSLSFPHSLVGITVCCLPRWLCVCPLRVAVPLKLLWYDTQYLFHIMHVFFISKKQFMWRNKMRKIIQNKAHLNNFVLKYIHSHRFKKTKSFQRQLSFLYHQVTRKVHHQDGDLESPYATHKYVFSFFSG